MILILLKIKEILFLSFKFLMESIYYRINHKKKLTHFDNVVLAQMKSALFYELSSKNESRIYDQILKIFNSLMKDFQYKPKDK